MEVEKSRLRVVLVQTQYAGNLGSVARVMKNFAFPHLTLVEPVADRQAVTARMMATRGLDILDQASVVSTIEEALADCQFVLATSGETRGTTRKGYWGTPEEQLPLLAATLVSGRAALLFGAEPSGLSLEQIKRAHGLIYIPANPEYDSLNLAQAVAICLYELDKILTRSASTRESAETIDFLDRPADYASTERLYAHLREALTAVRYLYDVRAEGIFHVFRQVLARGRPTNKEVQLLHGLAAQLLFVAKKWGVPHGRGPIPKEEQAKNP